MKYLELERENGKRDKRFVDLDSSLFVVIIFLNKKKLAKKRIAMKAVYSYFVCVCVLCFAFLDESFVLIIMKMNELYEKTIFHISFV